MITTHAGEQTNGIDAQKFSLECKESLPDISTMPTKSRRKPYALETKVANLMQMAHWAREAQGWALASSLCAETHKAIKHSGPEVLRSPELSWQLPGLQKLKEGVGILQEGWELHNESGNNGDAGLFTIPRSEDTSEGWLHQTSYQSLEPEQTRSKRSLHTRGFNLKKSPSTKKTKIGNSVSSGVIRMGYSSGLGKNANSDRPNGNGKNSTGESSSSESDDDESHGQTPMLL